MTPQAYCRMKAASSGSSFYTSFRFLPARKRDAITAFYAFCREVDDIVDDCPSPSEAEARLEQWRMELDRLFAGSPAHPIAQALLPVVTDYGLAREQLDEIIDGMAMDLGDVRYPDFKSLALYCHRVAGIVGEVAAAIFGFSDHHTLKYAARLGLALQLTNILRDIGEDVRRGRIYVPLDELARFDVSEADLWQSRTGAGFARLMDFQYQRARTSYEEALALLPAVDRKQQRPGLIMAAIYRATLEQIRMEGFPVLHRRVTLKPARKIGLAMRAWLSA